MQSKSFPVTSLKIIKNVLDNVHKRLNALFPDALISEELVAQEEREEVISDISPKGLFKAADCGKIA